MSDAPGPCLDENQLQAVLDGRMPDDDPARAHLGTCATCRSILSLAREASRSALHAAVGQPLPAADVRRGQGIGRYVILDPLGAGAMGAVYAAYDGELDRRIAVKVLRTAADPAGRMRQQLRSEAQAMARLTHPNVVRVYDVGEHEGALFIAMELVDGTTLAEWLAERPRSWREIAERFAAAASGLAAAHDAGVVHRDFKPSNVLVRGDGHTFVTDFGLARSASEPTDRSVAGTPRYMAPEVVFGEGATARSDQFAFGVALYEALYGAASFDRATLLELRASLLGPPPEGEEVPEWLRAALARALDPDPDARHPSLHELAETLARASDEDASERCARAGDPAEAVWNDAIAARVEAAFAATGLPSAAFAFAGVARAFVTWKETWARMARELCVDTAMRSQPEGLLARRAVWLRRRRLEAAALAEVFASADAALVLRAPDVVESLATVESGADRAALSAAPLPDRAQRAALEDVHADLARVVALREATRLAEAQTLGEAALQRVLASGYLPGVAECRYELGTVADRAGRLDDAHDLLARAMCDAVAVHDDGLAARALTVIAPILGNKRGDFAGAERSIDLAQALVTRIGGDPDLEATLDHARAQVAYKQGRLAEAIALYRKTLDARQRLGVARWATGVGQVVEVIRNNLANALARSGDVDAALAEHEALLRARVSRHGPIHPSVGGSWNNIGFANMEARRPADALAAFEKALAINVATLPPGHLAIGLALANTGFALSALRQDARALARLEEGKSLLARAKGPTSLDVAEVECEIACVQARQGALDDASASLGRAFAALDATGGRDRPAAAVVHAADGTLRLARGDARGAEEAFSRAIALAGQSRPEVLEVSQAGLAAARARSDA